MVKAKNGEISVKITKEGHFFYLHSKFNPLIEAENLVKYISISSDCKELVVLGMGAGYHIKELIKKYPGLKIIVFDFNYLYAEWVLENIPLVQKLIKDEKIKYLYSTNGDDLKKILMDYISRNSTELFIFKQSLELIEDSELQLWFKQIRLLKLSFENQKEKMNQNFQINTKNNDKGINQFHNKYQNKNFILVSAGPSLSKQLSLLKKISDSTDIVIVSVGTSFQLLLKNGIKPQFIMISDASDEIMKQLDYSTLIDIPLFFLSTANQNAIRNYKGPKYILWQKGYAPAEEMANIKNEPLIKTGGSVATCLVDLVVKLGAKSIALVGQDLAFTDNQTHADGIGTNQKVSISRSMIEVEDYYREKKVVTPLNLYTYKKWFEDYGFRMRDRIELWNCTEGGAYIENWEHNTLENYVKNKGNF